MWKNIAIVIVALLIIREINLMQNSLIISPDTHKIIANDQTILSNIKTFIKHEKDLFFKKSPIDTKKSKNQKTKENTPTLDDIQPILSDLKTLEDVESKSNEQTKSQNATKKDKPKSSIKKQEKLIQSLALFENNEAKKENFPTSYKSAQEKVFEILHQMGKR